LQKKNSQTWKRREAIRTNRKLSLTEENFLGSQKGKSEKGESKKAIAFLAVAFLFLGL
jgi:hypothetical protein